MIQTKKITMNTIIRTGVLLSVCSLLWIGCQPEHKAKEPTSHHRIPIIFDTDANNELDDQHAMAYLFYNQDTFDILAVTVNTTMGGGNIDSQYAEAERIMKLCKIDTIPLLKGADKSFKTISPTLDSPSFDGHSAVEFITKAGNEARSEKLVVLAVGKLTTMALALKRDPGLAKKIRLVWLGSNYPGPGEYNLDNDTVSVNYILNTDVEFEMVTVRHGLPSGTGAVKLTKQDAIKKLSGLGPEVIPPVVGRHGGEFTRLGDYFVNLFEHIHYDTDEQARALYDMAAVAIVKNPSWATNFTIPAPILINNVWVERPNNQRKVKVWENFNKEAIIGDFLKSIGREL